MKKFIIIFGMTMMCVAYFFMARSRAEKIVKVHKEGIDILLQKEKEGLISNYPKTPKEVIESHNRIMAYQYSEQMQQGLMNEAIATIRLLYSKELLELNPEEQQQFIMVGEILENKKNKIAIIKNEIKQVEYKNKESEANVLVKHYTTRGDKTRNYMLLLENKKWKINSWEDVKSNAPTAKTEEQK